MKPLVSIIIPLFNSGSTISETLQSLIDQTYDNLEIIIIDDGSTDNSLEIVSAFSDPRIKIFKQSHKGPGPQRNFGIKNSTGKYIALIDADDVAAKNRIENQIDYLLKNTEVQILGSNAYFIDSIGKITGKYEVPIKDIGYYFQIFCPVITSSIIFKREIINHIGYFRDVLEPGTDYEWLLNAYKFGIQIKNSNEKLMKIRRSKSSYTKINDNFLKKKMFSITNSTIENFFKNKRKDYDYYFKKGLIYYYYSNVNIGRKYFYSCIKNKPNKLWINLRYLIPSFLGNSILNFIRNSNISYQINRLLQLVGLNIAYKR